jgi:hypothetical protein
MELLSRLEQGEFIQSRRGDPLAAGTGAGVRGP